MNGIYTETDKGQFESRLWFSCDDLEYRQEVAYTDGDICKIGSDYIASRDEKAIQSFCYKYELEIEPSL